LCSGVTRRDLLRIGSLSLLGTRFSLEELFCLQAQGAEHHSRDRGISCIFIFLVGGSSSIDMWDMKPAAPAEYRGPFAEISTNVPGTRISEHLPRIARQMDKLALLRSVSHSDAGHGSADHWMMTGHKAGPGFVSNDNMINNQRPCHGAVVAQELGPRGAVPAYVALPSMPKSGGSAYLGPTAAPFLIDADPAAPDFSVRDLKLAVGVDGTRLENRQALIDRLDRYRRSAELAASRRASAVSNYYQKAFDLVTSPQARQAFDLAREPAALRDAYGRHSLGQSCLMARRLIEAGTRFVTVEHGNWDTHQQNFVSLETNLLPQLDAALSTLLSDLSDRGMLETTLVIATGEFGRTPKINKDAGRDHWPNVMTVPIAGGGVRGGMVHGASDGLCEEPLSEPQTPEDLAATIYHLMGVDYSKTHYGPLGRPLPILETGSPIHAVL
jgi:uncharacterized protein (DUF1501 family)